MKKFAYIQSVDGMIYAPAIFDAEKDAEARMIVDFFDHADLTGLSRHCYTKNLDGVNTENAHKMYQAYIGLHLNDDIAYIRVGLATTAKAISEDGCEWKGIIYPIEV